jgi:hypothetical protein
MIGTLHIVPPSSNNTFFDLGNVKFSLEVDFKWYIDLVKEVLVDVTYMLLFKFGASFTRSTETKFCQMDSCLNNWKFF